MGFFDSLKQTIKEEMAKAELESKQQEERERSLDTLRIPMRNLMRKGNLSGNDLYNLRTAAAKLGMDASDFDMRLDMILSAKREYDQQNQMSGLYSVSGPSMGLFFCSEDEINSYFENKIGSLKYTDRGRDELRRKVNEELLRPHFDSVFNEVFDGVEINMTEPGQMPMQQMSMSQAPMQQSPMQQATMTPPPPPMFPQVQYTLNINGQNNGPYNMQQLQQMAQNGQLTRQTFVWKQGMANWEMAGNVQELASLFGAVPPPPPSFM